ncbi:membrane-associated progesterone receptor component 1-like [Dendronephthya gigantea]|uniref:membrane-associated progesterone receptor component 1-like n=1 Tax=Dendronephthya gigantea TaxID=151771 RepID=UPI00106B8946|nr:membrane-associated progesterone receptor component 1-like [Dendronephthya gigantea]
MEYGVYFRSLSLFGKQVNYMGITWLTSTLLSFGLSIQMIKLTDENLTKGRDLRERLFEFVQIVLVFGVCFTACSVYFKTILRNRKPQMREESRMNETTSLFELRGYTMSELSSCNGSNGTIYIALNGKIFDVTKDKKQYDSGGCYKMLAGRDASRAFATLTFDVNSLRSQYDDLSDLNEIQKSNLYEWEKIYTEKYKIVGKIVNAHNSKSLQDIAMNSIIKNITISQSNTHSVDHLPLPRILKKELRNFFYEHME